MKLVLSGHDHRYAVEQIMLALFPEERPEYATTAPDVEEDFTSVRLSRGAKNVTASAVIRLGGRRSAGLARAPLAALTGKLERDRVEQKLIKLAFYRAGVRLLPEKPVWGALTGIRPGTLVTKRLKEGATPERAARELERVYCVAPERAALCADTARAALAVESRLEKRDIALYIGIPFCPTRCAYCSFVSQSVEKSLSLIPPFLTALGRELEALGRVVRELDLRVIAVYFGGGTPTTLSAAELTSLLALIARTFDLSAVREYCVEAGRPDTVTAEKLDALARGGVTRISINPQSMNGAVLAAIGRRHTPEDIRRAYALARERFAGDVNMDLIAGLPADTPESFAATLEEIVALRPENVTVHTLALKKGSRITLEGTPLPDKAAVGRMLDGAGASLRGAGYAPYYLYRQKFMSGGFENVGWSLPGHESLYNVFIMEELGTVLAAGGGGSTKLVCRETGQISRVFNKKYPKEYIESIEETLAEKQKILTFYAKTASL